MLNIEKTKNALKKSGIDNLEIQYFLEIDSTNTRAKEYAKENPKNRTPVVFIAERQTAGRGRLGRSFHSAEGVGIYISFLLYPDISADKITRVTPYLAVKLAEAIESVSALKPQIKWVNDLYAKGKKLAGILVETGMSSGAKPDYLVCGLGINVYKTALPDEISDIAISIEEATGEKFSREDLTAVLTKNILLDFEKITSDETFEAYKSRLITVGKDVTVIKPSGSYEAYVKALNPDYSLTLTLPDGREEVLFTGEVSIRAK